LPHRINNFSNNITIDYRYLFANHCIKEGDSLDEIKMPLDTFDLTGFIGRDVNFVRELGAGNPAPITAIPVVERNGLTPNLYENATDRTLHDELVKEHKAIYFPFSSSNTGKPVLCADGREYSVPKPENRKNDESVDLTMDSTETVGFVVKASHDQLSVQFAKQFAGNADFPASVETLKHVGEFEAPMMAFLETFISG
jgi:hypothetical protein